MFDTEPKRKRSEATMDKHMVATSFHRIIKGHFKGRGALKPYFHVNHAWKIKSVASSKNIYNMTLGHYSKFEPVPLSLEFGNLGNK